MPFSLRNLKYTHSLIKDEQDFEENAKEDIQITTLQLLFCAFTLVVLAGGLGFWAGKNIYCPHQVLNGPNAEKHSEFHSRRRVVRTFEYNQTFAQAPSAQTNRAWASLYPEGRGFIENPINPVEALGVSVFHQLHCLDTLRHLFYAAQLEVSPTEPDPTSSAVTSQQHASHCFDYLRQSLICAADPTLEPADEFNHINSTGVVHVCRDYDGLVEWAARRKWMIEKT